MAEKYPGGWLFGMKAVPIDPPLPRDETGHRTVPFHMHSGAGFLLSGGHLEV